MRRQRQEGTVLYQDTDLNSEPIGQSHLYVGRRGGGRDIRRPYSFLRIDVRAGDKPEFTINPFVAEWHRGQWNEYEIDSFTI